MSVIPVAIARPARRSWRISARSMGASVGLAGAALLAGSAYASDAQPLRWADLVPPKAAGEKPKLKPFFQAEPKPAASDQAASDDAAPPPAPFEGKFMQMKRRQPGEGKPPAVVAALNGKQVSIGGYVVPLDFEATRIKEFLLVPFVGACIHVPPPPANQIIYVKSEADFEVIGPFDPVEVTGTLTTTPSITGLADAGYTLDASSVELKTP